MERHVFPEDDQPEVLTSISPECQADQCGACPGIFHVEEAGEEPVFCVHRCHRVTTTASLKKCNLVYKANSPQDRGSGRGQT
jgi:hypothetical protein